MKKKNRIKTLPKNKKQAKKANAGFSYVRIFRVFLIALGIMFVTYLFNLFFFQWRDISEINTLRQRNKTLSLQMQHMRLEMDSIMLYVNHLHDKDEKLYRMLLGENPMDSAVWEAGTGGTYADPLKANILNKPIQDDIEKLKAKIFVQKASLDMLTHKTWCNLQILNSRPKIAPIAEVDFGRISSSYGFRKHPILGIWKFHKGLDITAPKGSKVYATASGVVIQAANVHDGYGKKVVIDHGNGYKTVYAHLNKLNVRRGQKINLATNIGEVGSTGRSNGYHLHYEVIKDNKTVNPIDFLYRDLTDQEFLILNQKALTFSN